MADLRARVNVDIDVIVFDNNSEDETGAVARERGARTAHEPMQGVGRARNSGACHAEGDVFVFVDADVIVPPKGLNAIYAAVSDPSCVRRCCGCQLPAAAPFHETLPARMAARRAPHGDGPRGHAVLSMACIRYDEKAWIGEDVDFYLSLKRFAKAKRRSVRFIRSPRVRPSCRRFDKWPI